MKIEIQPADMEEKDYVLILSDEDLDNDNFISITYGDMQGDFPISDLMPALIAFDAKRSKRLSEECECRD